MISKLTSVKDSDNLKKMGDFKSITESSTSVFVDESISLGLDYVESFSAFISSPKKVFYSNDTIYFYCENNRVYQKTDNGVKQLTLTEFKDVRNIIYLKNQDQTLIFDGSKMHVLGKSQSIITCPESNMEFYFDGRAFFVGSDSVRFNTTPSDIEKLKTENAKSYIGVSKTFGDIIYARENVNGITVLTKDYAVDYQTGFSLDEFYLKDKINLKFPVEENSVAKVRDKFYYVSNGKIISLGDKESVESELLDCTLNGRATEYKNYYLLPILVKGENYVFCLDVLTKKTCYVKLKGEFFGGYQLTGDKFYVLSLVEDYQKAAWTSKEIVLSKSKSKTIRKIEVLGKDAKIQVIGENGNALIYADDYAKKFTGITGRKITIKVSATGKDFNLEEILLYFR